MEQLTIAQAAAELGITAASLKKRLLRGVMQGENVAGRVWLIPRAEVERWRDVGRLAPGRKRKAPEQEREREREARDGATGH